MNLNFKGKYCVVGTCIYGNRRLCIFLVDVVADDRLATATTNWATAEQHTIPDEFLVLNDGDEAGLLDLLRSEGIVLPTGKTVTTPTGRTAHVCVRGAAYRGEH